MATIGGAKILSVRTAQTSFHGPAQEEEEPAFSWTVPSPGWLGLGLAPPSVRYCYLTPFLYISLWSTCHQFTIALVSAYLECTAKCYRAHVESFDYCAFLLLHTLEPKSSAPLVRLEKSTLSDHGLYTYLGALILYLLMNICM